MKILKLFLLLFPLTTISQDRFDIIREQSTQNNKYEYVYHFENNYAVFRTFNDKMGLIDSTGNVIIKPIFSFIYNKKELENIFEVGNKINKTFKRGFIDLQGNIKIPIIYDNVYYLGNGLIRITQNNKTGVLDTLNNIILPIQFDYISVDNNIIIAERKGINSLYDFHGKQIGNFQFTYFSRFNNDKAIITLLNKTNSVIDNKGNIILKPITNYNFEKVFNDDYYLIRNNLSSKKGMVNSKGEFIIPCKYEEIQQAKFFFIVTINGKKGFISRNDSIIKPLVYDEIYFSYFDNAVAPGEYIPGEFYIVKRGNFYGVINPNMVNDIIPIRYREIRTLFDNYYIVRDKEDKNGLFTQNGKKVLNEEYEIYNVFKNRIFASKDNKQYLINLEGENYNEKEISVSKFVKYKDEQGYSKSANQLFKSGNKMGVINYLNQIVIPCEYEFIENIYLSKEFVVKKNNKYGVVNSENQTVVEIEYDNYKKLKETILFTKDKKAVKKYHATTYR